MNVAWILAGTVLAGCGSDAVTAETITAWRTVQPTITERVQPTITQTVTVTFTPPPPPPVIESDGTYLVGKEIQPGVYRTAGTTRKTYDCYWARLGDLTGDEIIDNGGSEGQQVVEILPSDVAFETERCQPWHRVEGG